MTVREQVALSGYTTLGLGGPAAHFVEADRDEEVLAMVRAADDRGEPLLVLGRGSNLIVADDGFPGTVIRMLTKGIQVTAGSEAVIVTVAAGEDWDPLVERCVAEGLAGLECLSGIPGLAGATPIQNVGAYGQEVAETIVAVRAYDRARRQVLEMRNADCGFGYRTSVFKREARKTPDPETERGAVATSPVAATGRFVVLGVTFRLTHDQLSAPLRYGELARSLGVDQGGQAPLTQTRAAVLGLRRRKGMVLDPEDPDTRSAGSFFTNPVLDRQQFAGLERAVAAACGTGAQIPSYPAETGHVKVSAAWLIEHAGFAKGYPFDGPRDGDQPGDRGGQREGQRQRQGQGQRQRQGQEQRQRQGQEQRQGHGHGPRISAKHTLALVNPGGSSTKALLDLAAEITDGVRQTFGVELIREPVLVAGGG